MIVGRLEHEARHAVVLAVEHAQRVLREAVRVLVGSSVRVFGSRYATSSSRYAGRQTSSPIEFSCELGSVGARAPRRKRVAERDHLDVGRRALGAEHLDAELPELAQPARLRAAVPEHPRQVVRLERRARAAVASCR